MHFYAFYAPGSSWFTAVRLQDVVRCFKETLRFLKELSRSCYSVPGMTLYTSKEHMCRAALESTAFQAVDIMEAT